MANKKHKYKIIINEEKTYGHSYSFNYGNTKNIRMFVENNKATILFEMGVNICTDDLLEKPITRDAIKKAYLAHILVFGGNLRLEKIWFHKENEISELDDVENFEVYSLIEDDKKIKYSEKITNLDNIINKLLNIPINRKKDSRLACINAYIMACRYEMSVVRFIYLWMSFNAFYNAVFFYDNNTNDAKEFMKLKNINKHYFEIDQNIKNNVKDYDKAKDKIAYSIYGITNSWNGEPVTPELIKYNYDSEIKRIIKQFGFDIESGYCYLLTGLSYFLRCNILHGSKPLNLLCYENEQELKVLKFINSLLDEFMKANMSDIYQ